MTTDKTYDNKMLIVIVLKELINLFIEGVHSAFNNAIQWCSIGFTKHH